MKDLEPRLTEQPSEGEYLLNEDGLEMEPGYIAPLNQTDFIEGPKYANNKWLVNRGKSKYIDFNPQ